MQANLLHRTLVEVKQLISKPENWTQNCRARDEYGIPVSALGEDCASFCLVGAIERVSGAAKAREAVHEAEEFWREQFNTPLKDYNDSHSHVEVMAKLDELIGLTKEEIGQ